MRMRTARDPRAHCADQVYDRAVPEREQRVTPLELFFDLVFVFGLTQVTNLMSADPTWPGIGRGLLVLAALWWAWTGYAWLTNTLEPEEGLVRAGMLAAMAALLVVALAVPEAFGAHGVLFGVAYLIVRLLQLGLFAVAARRDPGLGLTMLRKAPSATVGPLIILAAGLFDGPTQAALWVIALGESIVAIGVGAAGVPLTPGIVAAAALGIVAIGALWWAYFDVYAVEAQRLLSEANGAARFRLARDAYSYLHLPLIAGIVLFALGLKKTIEQVDDPLATVPAVALCGGLALYFLSYVAFRARMVYEVRSTAPGRLPWITRARSITGIALLALIPAALELPALTTLALATGACCALIAYDVIHYREDRPRVRAA